MKKGGTRKSSWKNVGDLRMPNANWRLRGASRWWARAVGLPDEAVVFLNPDGSRARSDKTLGALRKDWGV